MWLGFAGLMLLVFGLSCVVDYMVLVWLLLC